MVPDNVVTWLKQTRRDEIIGALLYFVTAFVCGTLVLLLTCGFFFLIVQCAAIVIAPREDTRLLSLAIACCIMSLLVWDNLRSQRDDMSILLLWLIREMNVSPKILLEGFQSLQTARVLAGINMQSLAEVLSFLASRERAVPRDELLQKFPDRRWPELLTELRVFPGVMILRRERSHVSLTVAFRLKLRQLLRQTRAANIPFEQAEPEPVPVTEPEKLSPYDIIGVPPDASAAQIKAAYRARVKECHPDRFASMDEQSRRLAEEWTKALNAAYQTLMAGK